MHIKQIRLYNFRNFESVTLNPASGVNLLVGKNGQGKTNVVEAVNLISAGRSFRTQKVRELVRRGEGAGSVYTTIERAQDQVELGLVIQHGKREAYVDGAKQEKLVGFIGKLPSIIFSPTELSLIKGSAQYRRRFLDRHAVDVDPRTMETLLTYQRALKHKQLILHGGSTRADLLEPWNVILAEAGSQMYQARERLLKRIEPQVQSYYELLSGGTRNVRLTIRQSGTKEPAATVSDLSKLLTDFAPREIQRRQSLFGPHRDDLEVLLNDQDARAYASQGETRSLVLALKLAMADALEESLGDAPVLLLDDVESELDLGRREALLKLVTDRGRQVILTGTDQHTFDRLPGQVNACSFEVSNGQFQSR